MKLIGTHLSDLIQKRNKEKGAGRGVRGHIIIAEK